MSLKVEMQIDKLVSDFRLNELMEISRSGNDAFYLVDPLENQNSDILAWCFNPHEGHDQGDLILKDFLIAIYQAATENEAGDLLKGWKNSKKDTKSFVSNWSPSKVSASSFGSTFCLREYCPQQGSRIDLLIVSPEHKFIVIVENKVGDKLTSAQLNKYYFALSNELPDYQKAFVALDYYHCSDDDVINVTNSKWVVLNYQWLRIAERRAEHAIKRGNKAASLLKAYCRLLTIGEYYDTHTRKLIHSLAKDYRDVFQILKSLRLRNSGATPVNFWRTLNRSDQNSHLLRMYQQSPHIWNQMIDIRPIDSLDFDIRSSLDYLTDENCEISRAYSFYRTQGIPLSDGEWPLYIVAHHKASESDGEPVFDVYVLLRQSKFNSPTQKSDIIGKLRSAFPDSKLKPDLKYNRIGTSTALRQVDALKAVLTLERRIKSVFLA